MSGQRVRAVIYPTDDFTQAGDRYRWFDPARQVCMCAWAAVAVHRGACAACCRWRKLLKRCTDIMAVCDEALDETFISSLPKHA